MTEPREWLRRDERGTWEQAAAELVEQAEPKRRELGLSVERLESEAADVLRLRALTACMEAAKRREGVSG